MHATPAFSFFAGEKACTRRSSSSSSSRPRIAAPADRSTASTVLAAGGGTARLLAEARSCTASSLTQAEAIGAELFCVDPGVGRHSLVKARMCAILFHLFRGHTTKIFLKSTIQQKKRTQLYDISRKSTRDQETTNRPTYQRLYVWTRELSSLTREVRHGASRPDPHEICVSRVNRNVADRVGSGQQVFKISRVGSSQVETTQIFRGPGRVR